MVHRILRMMMTSSDRMADYLVRNREKDPVLEQDQCVRDSRELWDRYLIAIYEDIAGALSDPFKDSFAHGKARSWSPAPATRRSIAPNIIRRT